MTENTHTRDAVVVEDSGDSQLLGDYVEFKRMITPQIIKIVFWVALVGSLLVGAGLIVKDNWFGTYYEGPARYFSGIILIVFAPVVLRIVCEVAILFFRINETLTEINNKT